MKPFASPVKLTVDGRDGLTNDRMSLKTEPSRLSTGTLLERSQLPDIGAEGQTWVNDDAQYLRGGDGN